MTLWTTGPLWFGSRVVSESVRASNPEWYAAIELTLSVPLVPMVPNTGRRLIIQDSNGDEQGFWLTDE